jgi:hypothetical protein
MIALLISNLVKFAIPLGLFIWSLFDPTTASYVFIGIATVFVAYLFFIDITGKPKPDPSIWNPEEIEAMRKYHLALRFPFGAKEFSVQLNGIRWSSLIWVPWLLWNQLWIPAGFLVINFFLTASLSVRLDPFFFLSDAVNRGQWQFSGELAALQSIREKLNERIGSQQGAPADG